MTRPFRLVVLGGGTGSFTLLQALKELTSDISAVVNMCDDGGSTGVLRDELGVLPPGDARQCLVALSESPEIRDLFSYRFGSGSLSGHSLGNIILSGLELQHGSFERAVEVASEILRIKGCVLPVMLGDHKLVMKDGEEEITGQYAIETHHIQHPEARVRLEPHTEINPRARRAILEADIVVFAPGGFYSSLLPVFSVNGIAEALRDSTAHVVMVSNLVNKPGQTEGWHVMDYLHKVEEYIGPEQIDTVLYNTEPISKRLLKKYAADGEFPVSIDAARFKGATADLVGARLVSKEISQRDPADTMIRRTYIRHDPWRVAEHIAQLYHIHRDAI